MIPIEECHIFQRRKEPILSERPTVLIYGLNEYSGICTGEKLSNCRYSIIYVEIAKIIKEEYAKLQEKPL